MFDYGKNAFDYVLLSEYKNKIVPKSYLIVFGNKKYWKAKQTN